MLHAAVGAGTALITGGDPLSGGVGAVVGEAVAGAYRNGTFGNTPLDQNSPDYEARVEYGVKVAKVVTALCVGYAGGDIDAAVCAAENAARHNACAVFFDPNERTLTKEQQAEKDRLEIERFRAWNAQRIASGNLNTVEQLCELYNTPLPDQVLGAFASINEPIQEWQDNVQNTIQVAHAISPVTGFIANRTLGGIPNTLELFKLPTSCGGTLLTLAPGLKYVGAAGKVALNTAKPLLKSAVSLIRKELAGLKAGLGSHASRLGQTTTLPKPLSLQGANSNHLPPVKPGTTVLQPNTERVHSDFWNKRTDFKGNRVYQRDDLIDPTKIDSKGRTNLDRMKIGRAPIGPDNKPMELHHMLQTQDGPIAEVTYDFHKLNKKVVHINPSNVPSGIDRPTHDKWRVSYWKSRSNDF